MAFIGPDGYACVLGHVAKYYGIRPYNACSRYDAKEWNLLGGRAGGAKGCTYVVTTNDDHHYQDAIDMVCKVMEDES